MKKTKVKMKNPVYLGLSILDISKTLMYEFRYDYIKLNIYTDTDNFIIHIKTEDFYKDIANGVEKLFHTSNYGKDDKRLLPIGKNKKVIGLFKDDLRGKIIKKFSGPKAKTHAYLIGDHNEKKQAKGKMC